MNNLKTTLIVIACLIALVVGSGLIVKYTDAPDAPKCKAGEYVIGNSGCVP